ncbi:MAG TPA: hypothetical protein VGK73_33020 [Polyangiaceae bacterium]
MTSSTYRATRLGDDRAVGEADSSSQLEAPPASSSFVTVSQRSATLRSLSTRPAPRVPSSLPDLPASAAISADPLGHALLGVDEFAGSRDEQASRR